MSMIFDRSLAIPQQLLLSTMLQAYPHLISGPEILNGKPIIEGPRISVEIVLEWLANGASFEDMLAMHPRLT
jgi:uncharacterized protein (DUF433 family)